MTIEKLKATVQLVRSGPDWVAQFDEGNLSIWPEGSDGAPEGWAWQVSWFNDDGGIAGSEREGVADTEDEAGGEVLEVVQGLLVRSRARRTEEVLPIIKAFVDGPLKSMLVDGASFSRFVELINEEFSTSIKYPDLYPSWLFNAKATWDDENS
jgi:hypothetical protein